MNSSRTLQPYIGIADFTTPDQVHYMLRPFHRFLEERQQRILGVGVMTFGKMYRGELTRWCGTCPELNDIEYIFEAGAGVTHNCLHYTDCDTPVDVWRSIARALECAGSHETLYNLTCAGLILTKWLKSYKPREKRLKSFYKWDKPHSRVSNTILRDL